MDDMRSRQPHPSVRQSAPGTAKRRGPETTQKLPAGLMRHRSRAPKFPAGSASLTVSKQSKYPKPKTHADIYTRGYEMR